MASASITAGSAGRTTAGHPPPEVAALVRGSRPRKRWRYVAVFGEELHLCAAHVDIGPARQTFWALLERGSGRLRERTRLLPRRGEVRLVHGGERDGAGALRIADRGRGVQLDLALFEQAGIEALCAHGSQQVWTRKQGGIRARGTLALDGGPAREVEALAVIDDTCGHHARVTEWRWSAGVGVARDGRAVAWNLVSGVNDPPTGSERAIWIEGVPGEPAPVSFAEDLTCVTFAGGEQLSFAAEAERARRDRLVLLESEYRAPFGAFSGALPGGIELASGSGVMEHHRARW